MEKETHGTGGQTFYAPQIEHACRTHLHLYATINTQVMKSKVGEAWHTTNPIYTGVGATHEPITTFAKNRPTWINLTTKKKNNTSQTLIEITEAIKQSKKARATGLFYCEEKEMESTRIACELAGINFCNLCTLPAGSIPIETLKINITWQ